MVALRAGIRGADRLRHHCARRSADRPSQLGNHAGGCRASAASTGDFQGNLAGGTAALFRGFSVN